MNGEVLPCFYKHFTDYLQFNRSYSHSCKASWRIGKRWRICVYNPWIKAKNKTKQTFLGWCTGWLSVLFVLVTQKRVYIIRTRCLRCLLCDDSEHKAKSLMLDASEGTGGFIFDGCAVKLEQNQHALTWGSDKMNTITGFTADYVLWDKLRLCLLGMINTETNQINERFYIFSGRN